MALNVPLLADDFPSASEVLDLSSSPDPSSDPAEVPPHQENLLLPSADGAEVTTLPTSKECTLCNF